MTAFGDSAQIRAQPAEAFCCRRVGAADDLSERRLGVGVDVAFVVAQCLEETCEFVSEADLCCVTVGAVLGSSAGEPQRSEREPCDCDERPSGCSQNERHDAHDDHQDSAAEGGDGGAQVGKGYSGVLRPYDGPHEPDLQAQHDRVQPDVVTEFVGEDPGQHLIGHDSQRAGGDEHLVSAAGHGVDLVGVDDLQPIPRAVGAP